MKIALGGRGDNENLIRVGDNENQLGVCGGGACDFRGISLSIMFFLCVGKITSSSKLKHFSQF